MAGLVLPSLGGYCKEEVDISRKALPPDLHNELVKHSDYGVIVNGVVSWIIVQKETNPPEIWKSIAIKHYSDGEIKEAWKELAKLKEKLKELDSKLGMVQKSSRQKTELELDDIEETINKLTEAQCMPLVLASSNMMLRAPRFWGKDKGDDITGVAAEVKELKEAMVGFVRQNEKQLNDLKLEIVTATTVFSKPRVTSRNLTLSQTPATPLTPGGSAKRTRFEFEEESEKDVENVEVIENDDDAWNTVSYAKKAASKKETVTDVLATILNQNKRNEKPKVKVIYGNAKTESESTNLAADVTLVAFGVNKKCGKDSMKTFLIEKGIDVVDVEEMTREEVLDNVRVKTMKVVVKASDYEKAMDPDTWPCRIGVRLWKNKEAQKAK